MESQDPRLISLSEDECVRRLRGHRPQIGRLAFVVDSRPVVLPMNYRIHDGCVVMRTAWGTRLTATRRSQPAAFQIDSIDELRQAGWSVLVHGDAEEVSSQDSPELDALQLPSWAPGSRTVYIRLRPDRITGRQLPGRT